MSSASTNLPQPDKLRPEELPDIQGLIVRGYNMPYVRHFVLTVGNVKEAKAFLSAIACGTGELAVTSAQPWPGGKKPPYALNIGLTASGLEALALPSEISFGGVPGNFASFLKGAADADTANLVFDISSSDPDHWVTKLNRKNAELAHVVLSLYANTPEAREEYSTTLRTMFEPVLPKTAIAGSDVFELDVDDIIVTVPDGRKFHKIHFGYTDGISNPIIDSVDAPPLRPNELPYVDAWRFVLRSGPPPVEYKLPQPLQLGQNGSFSAFRILEQDVAAFDAFLQAEGRSQGQQEFLAAKMCGRWRNANPLVKNPEEAGPILSDDALRDFDYGSDFVGEPCPYSAHTRRANPRGGPGVQGVSDQVSNRIMRRANPYGPPYQGASDGRERGLAGHFICSSLANQFEFIMHNWVNGSSFGPPPPPIGAGIGPLLGHVPENSEFPYYANGKQVTVPGLSQFVTTRGGLYCFLPSITALKWMAANAGSYPPWTNPNRESLARVSHTP
jgi:hypothetical protein